MPKYHLNQQGVSHLVSNCFLALLQSISWRMKCVCTHQGSWGLHIDVQKRRQHPLHLHHTPMDPPNPPWGERHLKVSGHCLRCPQWDFCLYWILLDLWLVSIFTYVAEALKASGPLTTNHWTDDGNISPSPLTCRSRHDSDIDFLEPVWLGL